MRSDNGTHFVGAKRELQRAVTDWNQQRIADHLLQQDTQWIFNPPAASHMGGIWERQIRTVRSILVSLAGQQLLDDEGLSTLVCMEARLPSCRMIPGTCCHWHPMTYCSYVQDPLCLADTSPSRMPTVGVGARFSIWRTYFGPGGLRNTSHPYSKDKSGSALQGTFNQET